MYENFGSNAKGVSFSISVHLAHRIRHGIPIWPRSFT